MPATQAGGAIPLTPTPTLSALSARLPALMARDQDRLRGRLDRARGLEDRAARQALLDEIAAAVEAAERRMANRRAGVPTPRYPAALPVSERRDDIAAAFERLATERVEAVIVEQSTMLYYSTKELAQAATAKRLPAWGASLSSRPPNPRAGRGR